ncbi:tRNA (adenosine(37)-N6)-dimethylallyltransferase MiaA [Afifella aestuarii]|uniref:tRNA (adenosine(37)-N6)-dimethylallyltransferase MiaA n=1 Tax=Afifella aestuarii TaxID=1909496 RepID=UPI000FE33472|nr:tRNA (adenosine(37)-N6)-dimethylallyltransferase MiaA [Afifella aestuarii]
MRIDPEHVAEGEVVLIAGPTASGKTQLALDLAEGLHARGRRAVVVNADAMQVYRDLRVLTARPQASEMGDLEHRLFGHVDAADRYSVGRWLSDVGDVLSAVQEEGATAIFVGGTGLYLKALTEGLSPVPEIAPEIRDEVRARAEREGSDAMLRWLETLDPRAAGTVRPGDTQRAVRAVEVKLSTGRSLIDWQNETREPALVSEAKRFILLPQREAVYRAIDRRFGVMIDEGALEEVQALMARDLAADLPAMKAIGVRPLSAYLRGEIAFTAAVERGKTESRRYAKRQLTWLRHQCGEGWCEIHA